MTPEHAIQNSGQHDQKAVVIEGLLLAAEPDENDSDRPLFLAGRPTAGEKDPSQVVWLEYPNLWHFLTGNKGIYFVIEGHGWGIRYPCRAEGRLAVAESSVRLADLQHLTVWKTEWPNNRDFKGSLWRGYRVTLLRDGLEVYERGGGPL